MQTSNFSCVEPNANELGHRNFLCNQPIWIFFQTKENAINHKYIILTMTLQLGLIHFLLRINLTQKDSSSA